jgi:hypothetical protein
MKGEKNVSCLILEVKMGKKGFVYLIIAFVVFFSGSIYGDIPAEERVALISI